MSVADAHADATTAPVEPVTYATGGNTSDAITDPTEM